MVVQQGSGFSLVAVAKSVKYGTLKEAHCVVNVEGLLQAPGVPPQTDLTYKS